MTSVHDLLVNFNLATGGKTWGGEDGASVQATACIAILDELERLPMDLATLSSGSPKPGKALKAVLARAHPPEQCAQVCWGGHGALSAGKRVKALLGRWAAIARTALDEAAAAEGNAAEGNAGSRKRPAEEEETNETKKKTKKEKKEKRQRKEKVAGCLSGRKGRERFAVTFSEATVHAGGVGNAVTGHMADHGFSPLELRTIQTAVEARGA